MGLNKQFQLTREGKAELEKEHNDLVSKRSEVAEKIKTAREFGDLSENAEYQSARQEQENNEARITEIDNILQNATVIQLPKGDKIVQLGSKVSLKGESGKSKEYQVVGTVEADPLNGKISDQSPIGQALLGKKEADDVEIVTPAETATYKITAIS